jgi:nicotinamidase-related amidase
VLDTKKGGIMEMKTKKTVIAALTLFSVFFTFHSLSWADGTIIDEWAGVKAPAAPELKAVRVDPKATALLVLDIETRTCNSERRPRCIASVPKIKSLITRARAKGIPVVYSLTSRGTKETILKEVAPLNTEPIVKSSVDKFYGTDLEMILKEKGTKTVIIVGTAANGAVLGTAIGAAMRKLNIIVPVDGMSDKLYSEQYVAWHLVNAPGTGRRTTLTQISMIEF